MRFAEGVPESVTNKRKYFRRSEIERRRTSECDTSASSDATLYFTSTTPNPCSYHFELKCPTLLNHAISIPIGGSERIGGTFSKRFLYFTYPFDNFAVESADYNCSISIIR